MNEEEEEEEEYNARNRRRVSDDAKGGYRSPDRKEESRYQGICLIRKKKKFGMHRRNARPPKVSIKDRRILATESRGVTVTPKFTIFNREEDAKPSSVRPWIEFVRRN